MTFLLSSEEDLELLRCLDWELCRLEGEATLPEYFSRYRHSWLAPDPVMGTRTFGATVGYLIVLIHFYNHNLSNRIIFQHILIKDLEQEHLPVRFICHEPDGLLPDRICVVLHHFGLTFLDVSPQYIDQNVRVCFPNDVSFFQILSQIMNNIKEQT